MFREIRRSERITEEDRRRREEISNLGFKKIKPETDINIDECKAFWNSVFMGMES